MDERQPQKPNRRPKHPLTSYPDNISELPIKADAAIELSEIPGKPGKYQIESVKPIYRPPEYKSPPVKSHWKWVWTVVILLFITVWAFLYWYFSNHQAPYSAPIQKESVLYSD